MTQTRRSTRKSNSSRSARTTKSAGSKRRQYSTTSKRRRKKTNNHKNQSIGIGQLLINNWRLILGFFMIFCALFGIFRLGIIGGIVLELFRVIVGNIMA